jgi:hypothetical protein
MIHLEFAGTFWTEALHKYSSLLIIHIFCFAIPLLQQRGLCFNPAALRHFKVRYASLGHIIYFYTVHNLSSIFFHLSSLSKSL